MSCHSASTLLDAQTTTNAAQQKLIFEPVLPNNLVQLPQDFDVHFDYEYEKSIYFVMLKDNNGKQYWLTWNVYRSSIDDSQGEGWKQPHIFISSISVGTSENHWFEQRVARSGVGVVDIQKSPYYQFRIDDWSWKGLTQNPLPGKLQAQTRTLDVDLNFFSLGSYLFGGEQGYQRQHDLFPIAEYQYSAPFLRVHGSLIIQGEEVQVSGDGWLERHWGTSLQEMKPQQSEWLGVVLQDGRRLSITQNHWEALPSYSYGTIATRNGEVTHLKNDDIEIYPTRYIKISNGNIIPTQWQINLPQQNLYFVATAINDQQWQSGLKPAWRGAINVTGSIEGQGFMQLVQ